MFLIKSFVCIAITFLHPFGAKILKSEGNEPDKSEKPNSESSDSKKPQENSKKKLKSKALTQSTSSSKRLRKIFGDNASGENI